MSPYIYTGIYIHINIYVYIYIYIYFISILKSTVGSAAPPGAFVVPRLMAGFRGTGGLSRARGLEALRKHGRCSLNPTPGRCSLRNHGYAQSCFVVRNKRNSF